MTIHVELTPEEERALRERASLTGVEPQEYVHQIVLDHIKTRLESISHGASPSGQTAALDDLIDDEAVQSCAVEIEGKIVPSLEEVRAALSKIQDSMARVVVEEERAERFQSRLHIR